MPDLQIQAPLSGPDSTCFPVAFHFIIGAWTKHAILQSTGGSGGKVVDTVVVACVVVVIGGNINGSFSYDSTLIMVILKKSISALLLLWRILSNSSSVFVAFRVSM